MLLNSLLKKSWWVIVLCVFARDGNVWQQWLQVSGQSFLLPSLMTVFANSRVWVSLYFTSTSSFISWYLLYVVSSLQFGSWLYHLADSYLLQVCEFRSQLFFIFQLSTIYGELFKQLNRSGPSPVTSNMVLRSYISHPGGLQSGKPTPALFECKRYTVLMRSKSVTPYICQPWCLSKPWKALEGTLSR